jgi:hypothetical protein
MKHERDLQPWHGKLTGKIVLVSLPDDGSEPAEAPFKRLGPDDIAKLDKYENPKIDPSEVEKVFNVDNGSGRIHGIHAEGNVDAAGLLRDWLTPFASMGAGTVVASPTGGTDHVFMQAVGIPAYQFIQDPLDYESRVHHSGIDTFDHLKADDLRQASVVLAGVLFEAANSAKTLPRIPIPTQGTPTNPFKYDDPDTE